MKQLLSKLFRRAKDTSLFPGAINDGRSADASSDTGTKPAITRFEDFELSDVGVEAPSNFSSADARELRHAYWAMNTGQFGAVQETVRPLSVQFRKEIRTTFPIDAAFYEDLDRRQGELRRNLLTVYLVGTLVLSLMVLLSGAVIVPFLMSFGSSEAVAAYELRFFDRIFWTKTDGEIVSDWRVGLDVLSVPLALLSVFGLALIIRWLARIWLLAEINQSVSYIALETKRVNGDMLANVGTRLKQVTDARLLKERWVEHAKQYMILALWQTKRAEYFDRYSTVFDWKLEHFFERSERAFVTIQLAISFFIFYLMTRTVEAHDVAVAWLPFGVILMAFGIYYYLGWYVAGRETNDTWGKQIGGDVDEAQADQEHPFQDVAQTVAVLIQTIKNSERGNDDK